MSNAGKLYLKPLRAIATSTAYRSPDNLLVSASSDEITKFINNARRPVRVRQSQSRPNTICLYEMGKFEYFLERLGFFLYDNQQRRRDAHIAIEACVRPLLVEESSRKKAVEINKLHELVRQKKFTASVSPDYSKMQASATGRQSRNSVEFQKQHTVGNAILVPDGVSIVWAKPSDVIAEAKIVRTFGTGSSKHDKVIRPAETDHPHFISNSYNDGEPDLIQYYEKCLDQVENSTIVLELVANEKRHWQAAYSVAVDARKKSESEKSIMLLPPLECFEESQNEKGKRTLAPLNRLQSILDGLNEEHDLNKPAKAAVNDIYRCLDE